MKNVFKIILLLLCFITAPSAFAAEATDVGFINTSIWYSQKSFGEGDMVEVHTAVWNGEDYTVSLKVDFMDGSTLLGTRDVSITKNTLKDISISWKVTAGEHRISARISNPTTVVDGKSTPVPIAEIHEYAKSFTVSKKVLTGNGTTDESVTVGEKVASVLPDIVAKPVENTTNKIDNWRQDTSESLNNLTQETKNRIEELNSPEPISDEKISEQGKTTTGENSVTTQAPSTSSGIDKPIAYVELFLLTIASFIFTNSIVFYIISAVLAFIILRFIYRKIRR